MPELLQDWLVQQAERRPDKTALVMKEERIAYGALESSSNQLARALRDSGCRPGDRVGLLMPKSPTALLCILGVLKAGCVYVPIDTAAPAARTAKIVESSEPRCILAAGPVASLLDELLAPEHARRAIFVGWMEERPAQGRHFTPRFSMGDLGALPATPIEDRGSPSGPAHILFTSGSTGTPKGVVITHSNVIHFVEWANRYLQMGPEDRFSGHTPLHFDLSTYDIYGTLAAGAELHLVPSKLNLVPQKLADFIRSSELTRWFSVPSILTYMVKLDAVKPNDFPALRHLLWCGEVFPTPSLAYWMKRLPKVTFTNLYGPTEATIASSYYTVPACPPDERAAIPIGEPCGGEELLVLDQGMKRTAPGETGDLYIRGVGLSPGYWRDPEKTKAAFLPNPFTSDAADRIYKTGDLARMGDDGLVYFIGRADTQIKSRGYRIELGEIEAALNTMRSLEECAVVAMDTNGFEGKAIGCAYVPALGAEVPPAAVMTDLRRLLPSYMVPTRWLPMARLPKNANGKIDRRKLTELLSQP